jgi:subtilisin family serine protease
MGFLRTSIHKHIEKPDDYVRDSPAVRIAVLDTGIDKKHPFIRGALQSGSIVVAKSFVGGDESVNDTFGHGTYVTSLLLEVAPDAKLYVAKIATGEDVPADHNISGVRSIAFHYS